MDSKQKYTADQLVAIAKVLKPHGVHGEIKASILTDCPERFEHTEAIYLVSPTNQVKEAILEDYRPHSGCMLLTIEGVNTPEDVNQLRNWLISVPEEELEPLEEGEYWHFQLEGLKVVDPEGALLGTLGEIISTPAHDIYAVTTPSGGELLIPAAGEWVQSVDIQAGIMVARRPELE